MQVRHAGIVRNTRLTRVQERFHKMSVGEQVTLLNAPRDPRSKDSKLQLQTANFEITSLLPAEGSHFQYRVKEVATGRERVVLEDQIVPAHEE